jgi:uroporphyrinogen decarboxylase
MTNKERLQTLLAGGTPDIPPHWELVFQIPKEMFGIDMGAVHEATYASDDARNEAIFNCYVEIAWRLIEECGWAAIPPIDYSAVPIGKLKAALQEKALVPGYEGDGVFWMPTGSDMVDFAVQLYEQRADLHKRAREKCDRAKEWLRLQADNGADFFVLTYDFGFNNSSFVSPKDFRDIVTPYLTEVVACAHDLGKKAILHSDGHLTEILDQLVESGLDGYQSVDPQGGMDIKAVREQYPDWLLMGNVPCSLLQATDEQKICEAVQYCMTYGGIGKRYIFSTSNCIFAGMPPESYRLMLSEYQRMLQKQ